MICAPITCAQIFCQTMDDGLPARGREDEVEATRRLGDVNGKVLDAIITRVGEFATRRLDLEAISNRLKVTHRSAPLSVLRDLHDRRPAGKSRGAGSDVPNSLPVHRLGLRVGERADAPAVYVRAPILRVERLQQSYARLADDGGERGRYDYVAPAFDFRTVLTYDRFGLVLNYPGIAVRVA
jgi:hypothetical protein